MRHTDNQNATKCPSEAQPSWSQQTPTATVAALVARWQPLRSLFWGITFTRCWLFTQAKLFSTIAALAVLCVGCITRDLYIVQHQRFHGREFEMLCSLTPADRRGTSAAAGRLAAILASAGWHSACEWGARGLYNLTPFGHFLAPQGVEVLHKRVCRVGKAAVSFKPLHQSSSLRSRMLGPKQSRKSSSGPGCYAYQSISIAVEMLPSSELLFSLHVAPQQQFESSTYQQQQNDVGNHKEASKR